MRTAVRTAVLSSHCSYSSFDLHTRTPCRSLTVLPRCRRRAAPLRADDHRGARAVLPAAGGLDTPRGAVRYVVQTSFSGHQLMLPPANWCPVPVFWTTHRSSLLVLLQEDPGGRRRQAGYRDLLALRVREVDSTSNARKTHAEQTHAKQTHAKHTCCSLLAARCSLLVARCALRTPHTAHQQLWPRQHTKHLLTGSYSLVDARSSLLAPNTARCGWRVFWIHLSA